MEFGILSLLPPLLAIVMALITKQVLISLFLGVWIGATMVYGWNPVVGIIETFRVYLFETVGNPYRASVIIMMALVGSFAAMLEKGGGAHAFVNAMKDKVTTRKQGQMITWLGGLAVFFSDSSNPVIVGPIFRPITDAQRISREKLAYILDSTSAAVPAMLPITAWGAFLIGLIAVEFETAAYAVEPFFGFVRSIPFMFYVIGSILLVALLILINKDYGPMKKAEERAYLEGKLLGDDAKPMREEISIVMPEGSRHTVWNMIVPMVTLIVVIFGMFLWTGGFPEKGFVAAIGSGSSMISLVMGFFVSSVVAAAMAINAKVFTFSSALEAWIGGMRQMTDAIIILVLAKALGMVAGAVGTSAFIINATEGFLTPTLMFVTIFVAASLTAFATGTSWGTFGIFMPIAIPLAFAIGAPVYPAIAAVVSGGVFGDHCSPISDTTVLSSIGATCDHIDHVKTQLPYALTAGAAAIAGYVVAGITGSAAISMLVSLGVLAGLALLLTSIGGERVEDKSTVFVSEADRIAEPAE